MQEERRIPCPAAPARLAHSVIYTMGVPVLRRLTFVAGFAAEIVLVLAIFRWV